MTSSRLWEVWVGHIPDGYDEDDVIHDFWKNGLPLPVSVRIKHADSNYGFVGFERECQALDVLIEAAENKHCLTWSKTGEHAKIKVDVAFFLLSRAEGDRGLISPGYSVMGTRAVWRMGAMARLVVKGRGTRTRTRVQCTNSIRRPSKPDTGHSRPLVVVFAPKPARPTHAGTPPHQPGSTSVHQRSRAPTPPVTPRTT